MTLPLFAMIIFSVTLNALAQVTLRKAMLWGPLPSLDEPRELALALVGNPWLYAGLGCYAFSILVWLAVLSRTQVSVAYPMLSIGYVIAAALGITYLGETMTLARAGGIALICLGVLLIGQSA